MEGMSRLVHVSICLIHDSLNEFFNGTVADDNNTVRIVTIEIPSQSKHGRVEMRETIIIDRHAFHNNSSNVLTYFKSILTRSSRVGLFPDNFSGNATVPPIAKTPLAEFLSIPLTMTPLQSFISAWLRRHSVSGWSSKLMMTAVAEISLFSDYFYKRLWQKKRQWRNHQPQMPCRTPHIRKALYPLHRTPLRHFGNLLCNELKFHDWPWK